MIYIFLFIIVKAVNKDDPITKTTPVPPTLPMYSYDVSFKYNITFDAKLNNKASDEFKLLSRNTCELVHNKIKFRPIIFFYYFSKGERYKKGGEV